MWTDGKSRGGKSQRRKEEKAEERRSDKRENPGERKVGKVANHYVFSPSGRSKSSLAKAAGAEPSGEMRDEKLHAVVAWSRFGRHKVLNTSCLEQRGCRKSPSSWGANHVWKSKCEITAGSEHFSKLRCWKGARRCGARHISKPKCGKHQCRITFWKLRCRKIKHRCGAKHISKSKWKNTTHVQTVSI